jgi:hypothetical protein
MHGFHIFPAGPASTFDKYTEKPVAGGFSRGCNFTLTLDGALLGETVLCYPPEVVPNCLQ